MSSIEHLLLVGTSLAAETTKKSAASFCNIGIELILNALKCVIISQLSVWYPFKCSDKQWIVFLICLTTTSESPNTFKFLNLRSTDFLRPWTRASYFVDLPPQIFSKSMLGWFSIEGCIFLSMRNSISSIFSFDVEIRAFYRRGIFEWYQNRIVLLIKTEV